MAQDTTSLGPLEMATLGLVEDESPASVAKVQEALKRSGHDLAYTTVMTVMTRLFKKGLLTREREGKQFFYSPARQAGRASESFVKRVHEALFRSRRLKPIMALLDDDAALDIDELKRLKAYVDQKLKERRES